MRRRLLVLKVGVYTLGEHDGLPTADLLLIDRVLEVIRLVEHDFCFDV